MFVGRMGELRFSETPTCKKFARRNDGGGGALKCASRCKPTVFLGGHDVPEYNLLLEGH